VAERITFARTEEQSMLASTVRDFLESTSSFDTVRELSLTDSAMDRAAWDGLVQMGLVGLHVPEEFGGAGYSFIETAIVFEELGRRLTPVPLLSVVMATEAVLAAASDEQKVEMLPSIVSGDKIATLATFESAHDVDAVDTTAEQAGEGWTLSGTKRFVTDAPNAALFVVSARTSGGVSLYMVDANADGVTVTATPSLDATRPLGEVTLDNVAISEGAHLASGSASDAIVAALDIGVVALAQEQAAGAQRCLEMSVEYANERYQFGRAIGSFQAVKHLCADMLVSVEHAKSTAWHAARSMNDADEARIAVPLARSVCSDAYVKAAGDTIQIHGGIGFTWEHDAHLFFKRAKANSLLLGSVESYRSRLADAVGI
jgi:alkylation response protein AidB-like acyl-CoA dehydrogenase